MTVVPVYYATIYLKNGETLRFSHVSEFKYEQWNDRIHFKYTSVSTGIRQAAMFRVVELLGYTHTSTA